MKDLVLMLSVKWQTLIEDGGQDIVEYALVVAVIAFGTAAAMTGLVTAIGIFFTGIGTRLSTALS